MSEIKSETDALSRLRRLSESAEDGEVQSDSELLTLYVEAGDRRALEALIRKYSAMVASVCRLTIADANSAEDAFQATFLVLMKSASKIKNRESVAAWLHGVAYRTASQMRKKSTTPVPLSDEDVIKACENEEDPIFELARKMELDALDRELENLPERLRSPLVEHYMLGFSAPEIAKRMELSTTAVEGRLKRGRRKLRTLLAKRGISLSVLVAGSSFFQEHTHAADAQAWTENFVNDFLPDTGNGKPIQDFPEPANPDISSLVSGELSMVSPGILKAVVATGIVLVAGTFAVIASDPFAQGEQSGASQGKIIEWKEPTTVGAEEIAATVVSNGNTSSPPGSIENQTQALGQGLGGGMGGGSLPSPPKKISDVTWQTPDNSEVTPVWLAGGKSTMDAMDQNRAVLAQKLDFDFIDAPLDEVINWLTEETGTTFEVNATELDLLGVATDSPVTVRGSGSIRELFRRALDPLELTYRINESTIEVTSKDHAENSPSMRFYDLSYVLPNSSNSDALMNAMQQSIDPDAWLANGGTNSAVMVGSMMVVSAPDTTHQKIEVLLINLAKMNPSNVLEAPQFENSGGGVGGMPGGMVGAPGGGGGFF